MIIYFYSEFNILFNCDIKKYNILLKNKLKFLISQSNIYKKVYILCNDLIKIMQLLYVTIFYVTQNLQVLFKICSYMPHFVYFVQSKIFVI